MTAAYEDHGVLGRDVGQSLEDHLVDEEVVAFHQLVERPGRDAGDDVDLAAGQIVEPLGPQADPAGLLDQLLDGVRLQDAHPSPAEADPAADLASVVGVEVVVAGRQDVGAQLDRRVRVGAHEALGMDEHVETRVIPRRRLAFEAALVMTMTRSPLGHAERRYR